MLPDHKVADPEVGRLARQPLDHEVRLERGEQRRNRRFEEPAHKHNRGAGVLRALLPQPFAVRELVLLPLEHEKVLVDVAVEVLVGRELGLAGLRSNVVDLLLGILGQRIMPLTDAFDRDAEPEVGGEFREGERDGKLPM